MKQKILHKAGEMFLNAGFKSVTMDDIASEIGVSKKTIYKYFSNKHKLVEESTIQVHQSCLDAICFISEQGFSSIKENLEIKKMFREMFKNVGGSPLFQLKKYYPQVFDKIMVIEKVAFLELIKNNIEKGINEGYYRKNLNVNVCADFYLSLVFSIHANDIPQEEVLTLEQEALLYHTRAIATKKGIQELEKQLEFNVK